jgi:GNAT superfamily N-acetyltransferase
MTVRQAESGDAGAIAGLVNRAYEVEAFFVGGDRTSRGEIRRLMTEGTLLVVDGPAGALVASVYTAVRNGRGYFGMLAVAPGQQGQGLGSTLVDECERRARLAGATVMDITVVNLRTDLLPFYERRGYRRVGVAPYEHRPVRQACHFITMEKPLAGADSLAPQRLDRIEG